MTPVLTEGDRYTSTWQKIQKHYEDRLDLLRKKNDADHDPMKTASIRAAIREVKGLLSLASDAPKTPDEDALFKD